MKINIKYTAILSTFLQFLWKLFFPGQTPVPPRSGTWILDLSHDQIWAIWLAEVRRFHHHHDRLECTWLPDQKSGNGRRIHISVSINSMQISWCVCVLNIVDAFSLLRKYIYYYGGMQLISSRNITTAFKAIRRRQFDIMFTFITTMFYVCWAVFLVLSYPFFYDKIVVSLPPPCLISYKYSNYLGRLTLCRIRPKSFSIFALIYVPVQRIDEPRHTSLNMNMTAAYL